MKREKDETGQENDEIVGRLYALRAGLSKISEEADKLSAAEDAEREKYLEVAKTAADINAEVMFTRSIPNDSGQVIPTSDVTAFVHGRYIPKQAKEDPRLYRDQLTPGLTKIVQEEGCHDCWNKNDEDYEEQQEKAKTCYGKWLGTDEAEKYYRDLLSYYAGMKKMGKGLGIIALILAPLILSAAIVLAVVCYMFLFAIIVGVVALAVGGFGIFCLRGKAETEQVKAVNKLLAYMPSAQKEMKQTSQVLVVTAKGAKKVSYEIYSALENEFSSLLDPRDWKYLDLVIYYFETGRADTMKEALVLLEREVQTQRIISSIEMASERICGTIMHATAVISSQLSVISAQLSAVIGQQDMQNALLAKANVTSERLMSDVSYIKQYGV